MHVLVTGAAGFIGSHTVERILADGHRVRGVDCFTDYYEPELKRANLAAVQDAERFELVEADLTSADPIALLEGVDRVVHLAAQPGVRASWADGFETYVRQNVVATQRLLEAAKQVGLDRFVAASSSSIYGNAERYPTVETAVPQPVSPYGVTKLAAEHLCTLYGTAFGVPTVSLRYFTVYGPRQRPDMALRRMIDATVEGQAFPLYGDGSVSRSFTYVADVAEANAAALVAEVPPGTVCNVANERTASMRELIELVGDVMGEPVSIEQFPAAAGDARRTGGSSASARKLLGWEATTPLEVGVAEMVRWARERTSEAPIR